MTFEMHIDQATREIRFSGTITPQAMAQLELDRIDRQIIDSPARSASEHLQSLEIIFRRYEQQLERAAAIQAEGSPDRSADC